MEKHTLSKEILTHEYCVLNKTQKEIAAQFGISSVAVQYWMKKFEIVARSGGRKRPDLINKKFGKLLVLSQVDGIDKRHPAWNCLCDCGNQHKAVSSQLLSNPEICCANCGHKKGGKKNWTGYKKISGHFWSQVKWSAKVRNMEFDLDIKDAWNLYLKQNKKCALTGHRIFIRYNNNNTASLDRIDSTKHYTIDNIQWVHKKINWMKGDMTESEFINMCRHVVKHEKDKKKK